MRKVFGIIAGITIWQLEEIILKLFKINSC